MSLPFRDGILATPRYAEVISDGLLSVKPKVHYCFYADYYHYFGAKGAAVDLRHCAVRREVTCLIPGGVLGNLQAT
jgi:hypothetical protein